MDKSRVVQVLQEMADLIELESDNSFRSRSFRSAARALDGLSEDFDELVGSGRLRQVKGIGATIAGEILAICDTGESERHRELLEAVPPGVRDMLQVPGLGPKKARVLWRDLGVTGLAELEKASKDDRVAALQGFGTKSQEKILEGIGYLRSVAGRFLIPVAEVFAAKILKHLESCRAVNRVQVAGSFRRRKEVVKDLDFLTSTESPEEVADHFLNWTGIRDVVARGRTKVSVRLENGMGADLRLVTDAEFPAALNYFTGSKEHNTALRARAKELGFKLNEYGLFPEGAEESVELSGEEAIYEALGLGYVPPELRENFDELEMAATGEIPRLLEDGDLRGVVHAHTRYSDGKLTIEEMVAAARARGYSYLGVTDHSQTAVYAGGLKADDVRRQHAEIDRLNAKNDDFRIFKGIESDILADGRLDYPAEILDRFDFVIASLHSILTQPEEEATARVLRALEDPHTTFLGHVTARLLLRRDSVALNMEKVLSTAAELGVAVEINANPHRLELDWRHGPRARELGLYTSVNPDAHSAEGIDDTRYGVGIARKAGFHPSHVVNTYTAEEFAEFIGRRR